ncbi:MAG TPA: MBL fold metallo-hydrolase, partial [Actinomycetes bacterium]
MQLTKFTHACVRLDSGGRRLLIDPGIWAEDAAFEGVTDVIVTHEHFDHLDVDRL